MKQYNFIGIWWWNVLYKCVLLLFLFLSYYFFFKPLKGVLKATFAYNYWKSFQINWLGAGQRNTDYWLCTQTIDSIFIISWTWVCQYVMGFFHVRTLCSIKIILRHIKLIWKQLIITYLTNQLYLETDCHCTVHKDMAMNIDCK